MSANDAIMKRIPHVFIYFKYTHFNAIQGDSENTHIISFMCTIYEIKIYKTNILPVVLYECESWFLTLSDVALGGLGVTCSPRDPKFAGSNPVEVD